MGRWIQIIVPQKVRWRKLPDDLKGVSRCLPQVLTCSSSLRHLLRSSLHCSSWSRVSQKRRPSASLTLPTEPSKAQSLGHPSPRASGCWSSSEAATRPAELNPSYSFSTPPSAAPLSAGKAQLGAPHKNSVFPSSIRCWPF